MKKLIIALLLFVIGAGSNPVHAQCRKHSDTRTQQIKQQKRIKHGVISGELTRREAGRLGAQQAKIQYDKQLAKADGVVTPRERRHIKHAQARANRNIYRQMHDAQNR